MPPEAPGDEHALAGKPSVHWRTHVFTSAERISTGSWLGSLEASQTRCRAAARPTGIGRTTAGRAVARSARGLRAPPLGQALPLVDAGVRAEEESKRPDQHEKEDDESDFHTLSIGSLVD